MWLKELLAIPGQNETLVFRKLSRQKIFLSYQEDPKYEMVKHYHKYIFIQKFNKQISLKMQRMELFCERRNLTSHLNTITCHIINTPNMAAFSLQFAQH